jgi:beta-lactam-binding protein with PASTA domain
VRWRGQARRTIPYLVAATAGFILAYAIVALFVFPSELISTDTKVPNVLGLRYDDAVKELETRGFVAVRGAERYHGSTPAGTVLQQAPVPDAVERRGTNVELEVSRGQQMGEVHLLAGLTRAQAETAIERAGLAVGSVLEANSESPRGQVLASRPRGGERVTVPSAVDLTVSRGPATVQVPDVMGQSIDAARTLIIQLGLKIGQVTVDSTSPQPPGTVIGQTPNANQTVPGGSGVTLRISARPPTDSLP